MKKAFLLLAFSFIGFTGFAQWNYDSQNMIYSNGNTVSIGTSPQGSYGSTDRAFEINSPTSFAVFSLRAGTNSIQLINSSAFGNGYGLPNNAAFSFNMAGVSTPTLPALRIQTNGNISIGTSLNPTGYKLVVGGKIIAEELKVQLQAQWPDYVFTEYYKLPTLEEVEQHIKDKGYLANMPSAEEVNCEGFEIGELTRLQQEKIEELTLYIIELNKQLQTQEKRMQQLESKINK